MSSWQNMHQKISNVQRDVIHVWVLVYYKTECLISGNGSHPPFFLFDKREWYTSTHHLFSKHLKAEPLLFSSLHLIFSFIVHVLHCAVLWFCTSSFTDDVCALSPHALLSAFLVCLIISDLILIWCLKHLLHISTITIHTLVDLFEILREQTFQLNFRT